MLNFSAYDLTQFAGWGGAVIILIAYFCVTYEILTAQSYRYQTLNVVGSAGIAASALATHSLPSVALNLAWMFIACVSMQRRFAHTRSKSRQ